MIIMSLIKSVPGFNDDGLPDGKKEKKFVTAYLGDAGMLRYNSKLPIVVYTPDNVDVKYRVWKAEEKIDNAVVR